MTKAQERAQWRERHIINLAALYKACGGTTDTGETLYKKLRRIECKANRAAIDYANGEISTDNWGTISDKFKDQVQKIFNKNLKGFFVNSDCRGYALKINDEIFSKEYPGLELHRDWGGYKILAPEY